MASKCNMPVITIPIPSFDPIAILEAILAIFGITLPQLPTLQLPAAFCPLD
jgi:hypothetical protein